MQAYDDTHIQDLLSPPEPLIARALASSEPRPLRTSAPIRPRQPPTASATSAGRDARSHRKLFLYETRKMCSSQEPRQFWLYQLHPPGSEVPRVRPRLAMSDAGAELAGAHEAAALRAQAASLSDEERDSVNIEDRIAAEAIMAPSLPGLGHGASPSEAVIAMGAASYAAHMYSYGVASTPSGPNSTRIAPFEMPDVAQRRSFRVGWTAGGLFAHSGAPSSGVRVHVNEKKGNHSSARSPFSKRQQQQQPSSQLQPIPCQSTADPALSAAHCVHVERAVPAGGLFRGESGSGLPAAGGPASRAALSSQRARFTRPLLLAWGRYGAAGDGGEALLRAAGQFAEEQAAAASADAAEDRRLQRANSLTGPGPAAASSRGLRGLQIRGREAANPLSAPSSWFLPGSARHAAELISLLSALVGPAPDKVGARDTSAAAAWRRQALLEWLRATARRHVAQGVHVRRLPGDGGAAQGVLDTLDEEAKDDALASGIRRAALAGDWEGCAAAAERAGLPWLSVAVATASSGSAVAARRVARWVRRQQLGAGLGMGSSTFDDSFGGPSSAAGGSESSAADGWMEMGIPADGDSPAGKLARRLLGPGGAGRAALALASGSIEAPECAMQARSWPVGLLAVAGQWLVHGSSAGGLFGDADGHGSGATAGGEAGGQSQDSRPLGELTVDAAVRAYACVVREGAAAHPQPWWLERADGPLTAPEIEAMGMSEPSDDGSEGAGAGGAVALPNPGDAVEKARERWVSGSGGAASSRDQGAAVDWSLSAHADACWALLRMASTPRAPGRGPQAGLAPVHLAHVLRPSGSTPDPADCRLSFLVLWALLSSGHVTGYEEALDTARGAEPSFEDEDEEDGDDGGYREIQLAASTNESIARHSLMHGAARRAACSTVRGFAAQLEADGQWPWAVAVLMRAALAAPCGPTRASTGTIPRAVLPTSSPTSGDGGQAEHIAAQQDVSRALWIRDAREVLDRCIPDRFERPKLYASTKGMLVSPVLSGHQEVPLAASVPDPWMPLAAARRLLVTRSGAWHCTRSCHGGQSAAVCRCLLACASEAQALLAVPGAFQPAYTDEDPAGRGRMLEAVTLHAAEEAAGLTGRLIDGAILPQVLLLDAAEAEAVHGGVGAWLKRGRARQAASEGPLMAGLAARIRPGQPVPEGDDLQRRQAPRRALPESDADLEGWTPARLLLGVRRVMGCRPVTRLPGWHPAAQVPASPDAAPWRHATGPQSGEAAPGAGASPRGDSPLPSTAPVVGTPAVRAEEAIAAGACVAYLRSGGDGGGDGGGDDEGAVGASWLSEPLVCEGTHASVLLPAVATCRALGLCRVLQACVWQGQGMVTGAGVVDFARMLRCYALRVIAATQTMPSDAHGAWVASCEDVLVGVVDECGAALRHAGYASRRAALEVSRDGKGLGRRGGRPFASAAAVLDSSGESAALAGLLAGASRELGGGPV